MATDFSEFEGISPYSDEEAAEAIHGIARHPFIAQCSKYIFPEQPEDYLKTLFDGVTSVNELQEVVMTKIVERVIRSTMTEFTYEGVENMSDRPAVVMSNHRDIILDPGLLQYVLFNNGRPFTEIAVGDNLISNPVIEALIRSNRMVKVVRGVSSRELYLCSQVLSKYIRLKVTSGDNSVWIAQRQGRTKNGADLTEQGLLKMLDLSGQADFETNFRELNITPVSVSYEYEPCDILKARELYISRTQKYVKAPGEDINSIIVGVKQWKGRAHLAIGRPLAAAEIAYAALCDKNDRYQRLRHAVDLRIIENYKLWPTNFVAFDLLNKSRRFSGRYTKEEKEKFVEYMNAQLDSAGSEFDRNDLKSIFLSIYASPIVSKELLQMTV